MEPLAGTTVKKEAATKSERAILSSIANHLYTKYEFKKIYNNPTFGDVMAATGFHRTDLVTEYFLKKSNAQGAYTNGDESSGLMEYTTTTLSILKCERPLP
jgi:hypothetical protein